LRRSLRCAAYQNIGELQRTSQARRTPRACEFDVRQCILFPILYKNSFSKIHRRTVMAETVTRLPIRKERVESSLASQTWHPLESLRQEIEDLIEDFGRGYWQPLRRSLLAAGPVVRRGLSWDATPMVSIDAVESDKAYEITAELPGMDEKNIDVEIADGTLTIKGEKQEEKEQKKMNYYLRERHFGAFERGFGIPDSVDADKIEAVFKNGVLTVTLPKKAEAQKPAKRVEVKAA
jgi:HSP20 family protein